MKWLCGGPSRLLYVRRDLWPDQTAPHRMDSASQSLRVRRRRDRIRRRRVSAFTKVRPAFPACTLRARATRSSTRWESKISARNRFARLRCSSIWCKTPATRCIRRAIPRNAASTITLDVPNGYEVTQELLRRDFLVDYRPGAGIRIAPHFYTKDEELELVVEEIQALAPVGAAH